MLAELDGTVFAVSLLEVRGQPAHAHGLGDLLADGVNEHRVLVAGQSEGGAEIVITVVLGQSGRLQQAQTEALGTAFSALRLVLQPFDAAVVVLALPWLGQDVHLVGQAHLFDQLHLGFEAPVKFLLRVEIRVIPEQGHVEILGDIFQHGAGAGAAAAVQQHAGRFLPPFLDNAVQFFLIISVHGTHCIIKK